MLTTAREADELVAAVRFPVATGQGVGFHEVARRHGDFAIIAVAAAVENNKAIRVGVGGMAGRPMVRSLRQSTSDRRSRDEWAEELEGYEDLHASAALRRDLFRNLGPLAAAEEAPGGTLMRRVSKDERARVALTLNGRKLSAEAEPRLLLSDFLRHALGATGTHVGCEHGVCGCCTVMIDGVAQRSCLTLAVQAEGREVQTVESLAAARRHAQSAAAGVPQQSRAAMRLLHAGHPDVVHGLPGAQSAPDRGGNPRSPERPHLPLHRICRHRRRSEGSSWHRLNPPPCGEGQGGGRSD